MLKNRKFKDVEVMERISTYLDEETVRAISSMPSGNPE